MLRNDVRDRLSHSLRLLLPTLIFVLPLPFCFGKGVEASCRSLLGGAELLRGDYDPEWRSRWSDRRSDVYHIGERATTHLFVTGHIS